MHLSSGNYNEETAKLYADIGLLTTNEVYVQDVVNFFNFLTGHSLPLAYENLITAPLDSRRQIKELIGREVACAQRGLPAGIVIKVNALEDEAIINELYSASQAGVSIQLIVRGICCLIPGLPGISENITVASIIGDLLEHARIYYFHNQAEPVVYVGSMDMMTRSFDRRIEALFKITDPMLKQQVINVLLYNLQDNTNSYLMQADGTYLKKPVGEEVPFNLHQALFTVTLPDIQRARLFLSAI